MLYTLHFIIIFCRKIFAIEIAVAWQTSFTKTSHKYLTILFEVLEPLKLHKYHDKKKFLFNSKSISVRYVRLVVKALKFYQFKVFSIAIVDINRINKRNTWTGK